MRVVLRTILCENKPGYAKKQKFTKAYKVRKTKKKLRNIKVLFYLPQQYLNNTRIERMCLLLDKTDYQIPGTLDLVICFGFSRRLKIQQGDQRYYREQHKKKTGRVL